MTKVWLSSGRRPGVSVRYVGYHLCGVEGQSLGVNSMADNGLTELADAAGGMIGAHFPILRAPLCARGNRPTRKIQKTPCFMVSAMGLEPMTY